MKTKKMSDLRLKKMAELVGGGKILDVVFAERSNKYLHGTVIGFAIMNGQRPDNYERVVQGGTLELSKYFEVEYFDCVTCGGTVKIFDNILKFFKEVNRVLKKDGKILVSMTSPYNLSRILRNILFSKSLFSESNDLCAIVIYVAKKFKNLEANYENKQRYCTLE